MSAVTRLLTGETSLRKLPVLWLLLIPVAGFAASGDEFYQRIYERGMAHFAAGDYAHAFLELRNAAFGFVEHVDQFETAQSYAIIAAHRLGHDNDARDSLLRIVSAEKIQPHFRLVTLPDDVREEVDTVAAGLMTAEECTILGVPERVRHAAAAAKPPVVVPTPTKRPNVAVTAPRENEADTSPPDARPKAIPQPVVPVPQPPPVAPQPVVPAPKPPPMMQQPTAPPKQETTRPQPQSVTPDPTSQPAMPVPAPQAAVKNAEASLAEAQRAIDNGEIGRARSIYSTLLTASPLPHPAALRLAEGLYRVRDFPDAAGAFQRAGAIGHGEQYHYYYAVTLYETGHYAEAKRELALSLPYIAATADVAHYRAKIEGAIE